MSGSVHVLAFHRIARPEDTADLSPDLIDAYPADFEAEMRYVAGRYNVISAWELVRALREGYRLPRRALIITFDDGYRCFVDRALPVLKQLGLPVTLFVPTYYAGHPGALFWWDAVYRALARSKARELEIAGIGKLPLGTQGERMAAYGRLVFALERMPDDRAAGLVEQVESACGVEPNREPHMLLWDELASLPADLVSIGPHTRHHIVLAQAAPERVYAEVAGSWSDLRAHLPNPLPLFAYPNGKPHALSSACEEGVRRAGLAGAFTMIAGLNVVGRTNPYMMHRVGAVAQQSLRRFAFKLTQAARVYRRVRGSASERMRQGR